MQIHCIYRHIDGIEHPHSTRHKHPSRPFVRAILCVGVSGDNCYINISPPTRSISVGCLWPLRAANFV